MYMASVYLDKQLVSVEIYEDYEHFISDLTDPKSRLYSSIPNEKLDGINLERPTILSGCLDELNYNTDFDYFYDGGITVNCGKLCSAEDAARNTKEN